MGHPSLSNFDAMTGDSDCHPLYQFEEPGISGILQVSFQSCSSLSFISPSPGVLCFAMLFLECEAFTLDLISLAQF